MNFPESQTTWVLKSIRSGWPPTIPVDDGEGKCAWCPNFTRQGRKEHQLKASIHTPKNKLQEQQEQTQTQQTTNKTKIMENNIIQASPCSFNNMMSKSLKMQVWLKVYKEDTKSGQIQENQWLLMMGHEWIQECHNNFPKKVGRASLVHGA